MQFVLDKIIPFHLIENIPVISEISGQKIVELIEKNAKIGEIPVDRRSYPGVLAKLKDVENDLQKKLFLCGVEIHIKL